MNRTRTTHHRLRRNEMLRLSRPTRLQVAEGTLWITLDLVPQDILLEPGDHYDYDGSTPLLATPLHGAARVIAQPQPDTGRGWLAGAAARAAGWLPPRLNRLLGASS